LTCAGLKRIGAQDQMEHPFALVDARQGVRRVRRDRRGGGAAVGLLLGGALTEYLS